MEQRIGRLDRIGRRMPVDVVYFRPASGIGADVVRLFERLGLFREPIASVEAQLAHVERALEEIALDPDADAVRCAHRSAHRRGTGGAHARPRSGLPAAPSRAVSRRARTSDPRPRPAGPRRADGAGRRQRRLAARLPRRAGARRARLRDRVRQRGARRQPARRPGRHVVRRRVRSRVRGGGRDDRLLRLGARARRRPAGALRGGSQGPRRAARRCASPASAAPGSSPSTRTGPSSRSPPSTRTGRRGRTGPTRSARRPLAAQRMKAEDAAAHDWPAARRPPRSATREPASARDCGRGGSELNSPRPPRTFPLSSHLSTCDAVLLPLGDRGGRARPRRAGWP